MAGRETRKAPMEAARPDAEKLPLRQTAGMVSIFLFPYFDGKIVSSLDNKYYNRLSLQFYSKLAKQSKIYYLNLSKGARCISIWGQQTQILDYEQNYRESGNQVYQQQHSRPSVSILCLPQPPTPAVTKQTCKPWMPS